MNSQISSELSKKLVESMSAGVFIIGADGIIAFANAGAERIFGMRKADMIGRTFNDPIWNFRTPEGDSFPDEKRPFLRVLKSRKSISAVEMTIVRPDGTSSILLCSASPLLNEKGALEGVAEVFVDITERVKGKQALKKSEAMFRDMV